MKKNTKKLIISAGILGVGFSAIASASYLLTNMLVKVALERDGIDKIKQTPKTRRIITGFEEDKGFMDARTSSAKNLSQKEMESVGITCFDGTKLIGHIYPCENAKRIIIAMHGWRSSYGEDFGMMADFFNQNQCTVLYVEQRGQGQSGGDYMGFGLIERFDCLDWVRYANERFKLPIYLAGVSMGAATVLMASDLEMPETVKGIIADCGFTSPHAIWKHVANNNMKLAYGIIGKIADDMCKRKIQIGTKDYSAIDSLKSTKIPVLFIHGTDDHFVPITMTYENYKACSSPKKLLVVPGADHAMSFYIAPDEYKKAVISFWNEFDEYVYVENEKTNTKK
ncbi:MAG: alpha/beta hydrolase [Ruminococcaceae bacterium]|nr:alpha/beta hydrolase [Oscillospiraceae bacterium]